MSVIAKKRNPQKQCDSAFGDENTERTDRSKRAALCHPGRKHPYATGPLPLLMHHHDEDEIAIEHVLRNCLRGSRRHNSCGVRGEEHLPLQLLVVEVVYAANMLHERRSHNAAKHKAALALPETTRGKPSGIVGTHRNAGIARHTGDRCLECKSGLCGVVHVRVYLWHGVAHS